MAVPFRAGTKGSVLRELVNLAEQSWQVYDPAAILAAIQAARGAAKHGHARRRRHPSLASADAERPGRNRPGLWSHFQRHPLRRRRRLTDIFFLVLSHDDQTHLRVLARLSRLLLQPGFIDSLRAAETPAETWQVIDAAEKELAG